MSETYKFIRELEVKKQEILFDRPCNDFLCYLGNKEMNYLVNHINNTLVSTKYFPYPKRYHGMKIFKVDTESHLNIVPADVCKVGRIT